MSDILWKNDAFSLSELLREGQVTPVDILQVYLDRIVGLNGKLNAVVCLNDGAMADARASTRRHETGGPRSPVDGIPILIKDNLVVDGMPATWGSSVSAMIEPSGQR